MHQFRPRVDPRVCPHTAIMHSETNELVRSELRPNSNLLTRVISNAHVNSWRDAEGRNLLLRQPRLRRCVRFTTHALG